MMFITTRILKPVLAVAAALTMVTKLAAQDAPAPPDLLSFANGALPVSVSSGPTDFRTGMTEAVRLIDGNPLKSVMTPKPGAATDMLQFVYALPAPTRFSGFGVPNVSETPSPYQTFFRTVELFGSMDGPEGPFLPIASGVLVAHDEKGQVSNLNLVADVPPARWVLLRLSGGLDVQVDKTFFEFSEVIGIGAQDAAPMSDRFNGVWKGRGVDIELAQDGPSVTGCYDKKDKLTGTVDGSVLRAVGQDAGGVPSHFILVVAEDGTLRGLRSTNGAPFKPYDGDATGAAGGCLPSEPPSIGCGDIVHGIRFDFDSDAIRPESDAILSALFAGLAQAQVAGIEIVGHSSSEGAADYNRNLSQRRAASVVANLVARGLPAARLSAAGMGEDVPIASNDDEAGRSLNRRVEIRCSG